MSFVRPPARAASPAFRNRSRHSPKVPSLTPCRRHNSAAVTSPRNKLSTIAVFSRVVSLSPGVAPTPIGQAELRGTHGEAMRGMIAASGTGRIGTPDDVVSAAKIHDQPAGVIYHRTDLSSTAASPTSTTSGRKLTPEPSRPNLVRR